MPPWAPAVAEGASQRALLLSRLTGQREHVLAQVEGLYLRVPLEVPLQRVRARTNNPYGQAADERADIIRYVAEVEPLIRRTATLELDGQLPIAALADRVEPCLESP